MRLAPLWFDLHRSTSHLYYLDLLDCLRLHYRIYLIYNSSISQDSDNSSKKSGFRYFTTPAASTCTIRSRKSGMEIKRQISFIAGVNLEKVGRFTSVNTFRRRSSGATR